MSASETYRVEPAELLAHLDWLRALARRLVADAARAEDVAQETWRHALERPPAARTDLRAWLAAVARNAARQLGRSESARAGREAARARRDRAPSAAECAELAARQRELVGHVLDLDPPSREVLLLRFFRDLPPRAIARELDLPLNTVRSRQQRALERLRERLDAEAGGRERWLAALAPLAAPPAGSVGVSSAVVAGVALGAAALVGVVAVALSRADEGPVEIATGRASTRHPSSPELVGGGDGGSGAVRTSAAATTAASGGPAAATRRRSALELLVVDGASGAPVPDLAFRVFKERGGDEHFATGRTDADGRATVADLPENTILVRTERRPPHASGFAAVWTSEGTAQEVEIALGPGGSVAGRVVDDLGAPLEGMAIWAHRGAMRPVTSLSPRDEGWVVVAATDARGRYLAPHLVSDPRGVWVVEGEARPESWTPVALHVGDPRWGFLGQPDLRVHVRAGEVTEAPDAVVPRPARLEGRVLEASGAPVIGALVSGHPRRFSASAWSVTDEPAALRPGQAGFELLPGEELTDGAGAFSIEWPVADEAYVMVVAPDDRRETFPMQLRPGAEERGRELVLSGAGVLRLELVHEDGAPVEPRDVLRGDSRALFEGPTRFLGVRPEVRLRIGTAAGELHELETPLERGGRAVAQLPCPPADVRTVELFAYGYLPIRTELAAGVSSSPLRVVLREPPVLRLAVDATDALRAAEVDSIVLIVGACLGHEPWGCGLGSRFFVTTERGRAEWDHPVLSDEAFWVHVTGNVGPAPPSHRIDRRFGPFAPGPGRHELTLTADDLEPVDWPDEVLANLRRPERRSEAPEPSQPPADDASVEPVTVGLTVVDASTGAPIAGVEPFSGDAGVASVHGTVSDESGRMELSVRTRRAAGVGLNARGYEAGSIEVPAGGGGHVELGTVALEPLPRLAARLFESDGAPAAGYEVWLGATRANVDGDGRFAFFGELPGAPYLVVHDPGGAVQYLDVPDWSLDDEVELRLAPWREVVVRVRGIPEARRWSSLRVWATADVVRAAVEAGNDRPGPSRTIGCRELAPEGAVRRFRFVLAEGRYRLSSRGLHEVPDTDFDVLPGDGEQILDVVAR